MRVYGLVVTNQTCTTAVILSVEKGMINASNVSWAVAENRPRQKARNIKDWVKSQISEELKSSDIKIRTHIELPVFEPFCASDAHNTGPGMGMEEP